MAGAVIRAQIKLEGGRAFADDFKKAASEVKKTNAELGYFTTALDKNGKSQDALANKSKAVQSAFDAEQKVIDTLTKRIEELSNMTGVDTTQAVDELTAELYKHKQAQAELGDQVDDTTEDFNEFGTQVGISSAVASKALDIIFDIGKKVFEIGKDAVQYNAQMESYSRTIEAFFTTSGQSAEEAAANTAQLIQNQKDLSLQIGIGTDKLIDANKMLIASGVSGDKSQQAVSALAKAIVATGGGNEELSRMAQNLQQISNTGKASAQDMKQFAMAGVDVYGLMADSTGKTVEELKKMDITFDMITEALTAATAEGGKFYEASQVGATTLNGQINILQSTVRDKLGTAFEPFNVALRDEILPQVMELVEKIDWDALGTAMADAAKAATTAFGVLAETVSTVAEAYKTIKEAVDDWGNVTDRVTNDVSNNYLGMAGAYKKSYDEHQRFASGTQRGMDTILNKTTDVNKAIAGMPTAWSSGIPKALEVGTGMANAVSGPLRTLASESPSWGVHMIDGFIGGINAKVPSIGTAAQRAANAIRQVLEFTRPDEGPLHNYEQWMPHMMQGLEKGILDNLWRVEQASGAVAATLAAPQMVATYNGGINMTVNAAPGQSAQQVADEVMNRIQRATQRRVAVWA